MRASNIFLVIIELVALIAGVTLAILWFNDPSGNYEPLIGLATFIFIATEIVRRLRPKIFSQSKSKIDVNELADFILDGQNLLSRLEENSLPAQDFNDWVQRMNRYFEDNEGITYKVRLSDFSGMVFYGNGSEKSQFQKAIDGRLRRLHEFISELSVD